MLERFESGEPEKLKTTEKRRIIERLFELRHELEVFIDIEEEDLEDLVGQDDIDFLSNLTTTAIMNGFDPDDFFELLDMPARFREPPEEKARSTTIIESTLGSKALERLEKAPEQE